MKRSFESPDEPKKETPSTNSSVPSSLSQKHRTSSGTATGSSAETQPYQSQPYQSQQEEIAGPVHAWGRLTDMQSGVTHSLVNPEYTVGRGGECDIRILSPADKGLTSLFLTCSKVHFKIYQEQRTTGTFAFIRDLSSNGTIIKGTRIGKGHFEYLKTYDVICLVKETNRVFLFESHGSSENKQGLPPEVSDKYTFVEELGQGAWGRVMLVLARASPDSDRRELYACKIIEKKSISDGDTPGRDVLGEVNIMKDLSHPGIVRIHAVTDSPKALYIFMELVECGDLFNLVKNDGALPEEQCKSIMYQLFLAVKYLHDVGVVHRDLKPENVLLTSHNPQYRRVKITDFGLSKVMDSLSQLKTTCGTKYYMAPEVIKSSQDYTCYTKAVDLWSLGVMLYVCMTAQPAFSPQRKDLPFDQQVLTGNVAYKDKHWVNAPLAKDLTQSLIEVNVEERISVEKALSHTWFQDETMKRDLERLLDLTLMQIDSGVNPSKRPRPGSVSELSRNDAATPLLKHNLLDAVGSLSEETTATTSPGSNTNS